MTKTTAIFSDPEVRELLGIALTAYDFPTVTQWLRLTKDEVFKSEVISQGVLVIMAKAKTQDADDILGTSPKAKAPKPAAKPAAKAAAKKAPVKVAAKTAKAKNGASDRSARGEGKFYFDPDERTKVKGRLKGLKAKASTKDIAAKLGIPTWQVRLAAKDLVAEKVLKMAKEGNVFMLMPK